ncbi:hypothetical protein NUW58_g7521 [Xylaria curta]|uniref:Uncharacterized protein n=1 Tax=Xylaria curta TaxID=42375 RepID=A0ACC1NHI5_9PEZI|nr:hypothetical protein NUW58_g7521 [Xylaria curta]
MEVNDSEDTTVAFPGYTLRPLQQPQPPQMHLPPTQHQLLVAQHSTPPRQYTTVGSVYNPQPHPRQPPVRRGRTIKSLYPYKSESPAGPSQVQYTPLQQNSDRAVSPARLYSRSPPSTLTVTNQTRRVLQKFGVAIPTVHAAGELPGRARHADDEVANSIEVLANPTVEDGSTMFANMRAESEDESDGANTKPISAMNFNSLTNLASYPNPMQRAAQKVLASHRPLPTPAIGSHVSEDQSFHCDGETDPLVPLVEDSGFMSALPRVRGAPAPLTAGPPGVRQLRPTTFEQESLRGAREFDDEHPWLNPYHARLTFSQHASGLSLEDGSISGEEDGHNDSNLRIIDTLPIDEAAVFYPDGIPSNFNPHQQYTNRNWQDERIMKIESQSVGYLAQKQEEFWAERRRNIDNHFYSGSNAFNKPFEEVVSEFRHRGIAYLVGCPYEEPAHPRGKVINRQLQICDASHMPASEHAAPLLSMAFQAITNHPNISPNNNKLPRFEQSLYPSYLKG